MRRSGLFALAVVGLQGCGDGASTEEPLGTVGEGLSVFQNYLWDPAVVPVCFEPDGHQLSGTALANAKGWVRDSVTAAWQDNSLLRFTGWGTCDASSTDAVRVLFLDWPGFSRASGTALRGMEDGVWISTWPLATPGVFWGNCDEINWQGSQKTCIEWTAVHEFGHVLSFAHEHNRADSECDRLDLFPTPGDRDVTPYDRHSVMNYCARFAGNPGWPSLLDALGLQHLYGRPPAQPPALGNLAVAQQSATRTALVSVGTDGALYARSVVQNGRWSAATRISSVGFAAATAGVTLAKREPSELDAFAVGADGKLYYTASVGEGTWSNPVALTAAGFAPSGATVATGVRGTNQLNVFVIGSDGAIKVVTSTGTGAFQAPVAITPANFAPPGGGLATAKQNGTQLGVFAVANGGTLKGVAAAPTGAWGAPFSVSATGVAPAGAQLATGKEGTNQVDVFVVGNDGGLKSYAAVGLGAWSGPTHHGGGSLFSGQTKIATVSAGGTLTVFAVGNSGALYTAKRAGTSPWAIAASTEPVYAGTGAGVAAAVMFNGAPNVFLTALNGLVRGAQSAGGWTSFAPMR